MSFCSVYLVLVLRQFFYGLERRDPREFTAISWLTDGANTTLSLSVDQTISALRLVKGETTLLAATNLK